MGARARRHRWWIVPGSIAVTLYVAAFLILLIPVSDYGARGLLALVAEMVRGVAVIMLLVITVGGATRLWRRGEEARRRRGRFTKRELAQQEADRFLAAWWDHAVNLRANLLQRRMPVPIETWEVVSNPGELFFFDTHADYARYYGADVHYQQSATAYGGSPLFVLAGVAATAISNASARNVAIMAAREQWREQQSVRMLVSNQRLVLRVGTRWLSFHYSAITSVYPELEHWLLVCQFENSEPLMIRGPSVPATTMIVMFMTHGESSLARHPQFASLD